jgi:hypothetical protein
MMLSLLDPAALSSGTSTALFWLIGGVLVLVSLQLRRFSAARPVIQPNAVIGRRVLIRPSGLSARQLAVRQ